METDSIVQEAVAYVKAEFENETSGHDWWHIYRVWQMAITLTEAEGGDRLTVELAALLHDLDDYKLHENGTFPQNKAARWLAEQGIADDVREHVLRIIDQVSFKGAGVVTVPDSLEGAIVQDADRIDAIGAIGIARAFTYGGHKGQLIYDPSLPVRLHSSFQDYKSSSTTTINHFHEKLLVLKDRINTDSGKRIAERRHRFLEIFLEEFMSEWNFRETK